MNIVTLKGGLGNQLFEYGRYRRLQQKEHSTYLYYYRKQLKQHGNILLSDCFDVTLPPQNPFIVAIVYVFKLFRALLLFKHLYDDEQEDCTFIDDYCQHKPYAEAARDSLNFKKLELSDYHKKIVEKITADDYPVAIHVRRGDYLHPANIQDFGICPIDYYTKGIEYIKSHHPEATFFLFSDDIAWTKEHLKDEKAVYVEPQEGCPDYIDLFLMTLCKGHIIANSTFSFWGAYLSRQQPYCNVYPRQWFKNETWNKPDFIPADWQPV
jgi:hypothetical protein